MDLTRKQEERALDAEEREMVASTHHPDIQAVPDADLVALSKRVRERRDRAQSIARQRRREMRGKGAPKGAHASTADHGSRLKAEILGAAMRRINAEVERRRQLQAKLSLMESQRRALAMVQAHEVTHHAVENTRTAREGMRDKHMKKPRRIGSRMGEAGRVSQFVKVAQAKRDARGA